MSVQGTHRTVMSNPTWNSNSLKVLPFFNYMALLQVGLMMHWSLLRSLKLKNHVLCNAISSKEVTVLWHSGMISRKTACNPALDPGCQGAIPVSLWTISLGRSGVALGTDGGFYSESWTKLSSYLMAILGNILPFFLVTHGGLPVCLQLNDLLDRLSWREASSHIYEEYNDIVQLHFNI